MYHYPKYHFRRRYKTKPEGTLAFLLLAVFLVLLIPVGYASTTLQTAMPILIGIGVFLLCIAVALLYISHQRKQAALRAVQLSDIDSMSGVQFEKYVGSILQWLGYQIHFTKVVGDFGTDIVASKDHVRYSIQLKRYGVNDHVGRVAVSDAVGAMKLYKCEASMVITSSFFTRDGCRLAKANHTILVDREQFGQWIIAFQRGEKHK